MVIKALHFLLLPIAATFGWYFGKRDHASSQVSQLRRDYFQGLSYLINEQSDKAVDVFIKLSEIDSDTAEIHLALGHLFRRRGEVDRAIRIHQNLLARPELDDRYHFQALFALGQDFLRAGVLDRAEQIFLELGELKQGSREEKIRSLQFLLRIYQQEKDWNKALSITEKLFNENGEATELLYAQFHCELAEQEARQKNYAQALKHLQHAIQSAPNCVRANLIAGRLALETHHYREAIRHYQQVKLQNIQFIPEIIVPLCQCYGELQEEKQLVEYLCECLKDFPALSLVLTVAKYIQRNRGDQAALDFIAAHLNNEPALHGLKGMASLYLNNSQDGPSQKFMILQNIIQQMQAEKSTYRCRQCGFSSKLLFWHCPSCHCWETIRPSVSVAGGM